MSASPPFICPYCGEIKNRAEQSLEHPLPRALGGHGFSSRDFCDPCNKRVGQEVDRPFVEHHIMQTMRHVFGVPDARGEVPPAPRLYGISEDGGKIYLELGKQPRVRRVPHKVRDDETGVAYITDVGEGEEHAAKVKGRIEKRLGEGFRVGEATTERIEDPGTGSINTSLKLTAWPRFGAKLALAFGREVLGEAWVSSEGAARLRLVLWDEPGAPEANPLWEQTEGNDPWARLVPPPQHLVAVCNSARGCGLIVQLFGGLRYGVPLSDIDTVSEPTVWTFDPIAGKASRSSLMELIGQRTAQTGT